MRENSEEPLMILLFLEYISQKEANEFISSSFALLGHNKNEQLNILRGFDGKDPRLEH